MNNFQYQQKERLIVEQELKYWADRYNKTNHPILKKEIDFRVKQLVCTYETQARCLEYHLDRYERLKR